MALSVHIGMFIGAFALTATAVTAAAAPWAGLVSDVVPKESLGSTSGWIG